MRRENREMEISVKQAYAIETEALTKYYGDFEEYADSPINRVNARDF